MSAKVLLTIVDIQKPLEVIHKPVCRWEISESILEGCSAPQKAAGTSKCSCVTAKIPTRR